MTNPYEPPQASSTETERSDALNQPPQTRWRGLLIFVLVLVGFLGASAGLEYLRLVFAAPLP